MRTKLNAYLGSEVSVTGWIERYRFVRDRKHQPKCFLLLTFITLEQHMKTIQLDHAWVRCTKPIQKMNLPIGSQIRLNCQIEPYVKGHRSVDYGLEKPKNVFILHLGSGPTYEQFIQKQTTDS